MKDVSIGHAIQAAFPFLRFQLEHIIPRQHGGQTVESNLTWACQHCNLHKGPNLSGIDPESRAIVQLFHPRQQAWDTHFGFSGPLIVGLSAIGKATARVLNMNASSRIELRSSS